MSDILDGWISLAGLALDQALLKIGPKTKNKEIDRIVSMLDRIPWSYDIFKTMGTKKCNDVMQKIRGTSYPKHKYLALKATFDQYIDPMGNKPQSWSMWADLITKYKVDRAYSDPELRSAVWALERGTVKDPLTLADITKLEALALDQAHKMTGVITTLWQCARCHLAYPHRSVTANLNKSDKILPHLLLKLHGKELDDTLTAKQYDETRKRMGLDPDFDKLTPGAKVKFLAESGFDPADTLLLLTLGSELNLLRSVKSSLGSVRSGIASYMRFCALVARPAFPPSEETVRLWSGTFNPGKTFNQYLAHLQKTSLLMHQPLDWLTPTIRGISKGLKNAQDLSFKFPNFIQTQDLLKLLRYTKVDSSTGQLFFLSYLFALRVPSETLRLTRAYADDPLTQFIPQKEKALIAVRFHSQTPVLVIKFAFRKNVRNGCILMRPCLCLEEDQTAQRLCPVHTVWEFIKERVDPGDLLFPDWNANKVNRTLKIMMTQLKFDQGGKYSSHAFRRGATNEVKSCGSTLATILKTGTWTSASYKNYLDLQADEAINISQLLIEGLGSDSGDSDHDRPQKQQRRIKKMTRKMRKIPLTFVAKGSDSDTSKSSDHNSKKSDRL